MMLMQKSLEFEGYQDEELVRLSQAGRRDAFSELTRRNYNSSLKLAVSILHDREEAEDEVQNAYWKAFQHIDQFHVDAKFSTWMTRIVVNQCLTRLQACALPTARPSKSSASQNFRHRLPRIGWRI